MGKSVVNKRNDVIRLLNIYKFFNLQIRAPAKVLSMSNCDLCQHNYLMSDSRNIQFLKNI